MDSYIAGYIVFGVAFLVGVVGYLIGSRVFKQASVVYENPEALNQAPH